MKVHQYLILILFVSCTASSIKKDNQELSNLYEQDQADRKSDNIDWSIVLPRDSIRRVQVLQFLDNNEVQTGKDYYHAAMIFQHGQYGDSVSSKMAVDLIKKALELDSTVNKWLYAAAVDRNLMYRGQPQWYGTQWYRSSDTIPFALYTVDTLRITDEERKMYNVPSLSESRQQVADWNKENGF